FLSKVSPSIAYPPAFGKKKSRRPGRGSGESFKRKAKLKNSAGSLDVAESAVGVHMVHQSSHQGDRPNQRVQKNLARLDIHRIHAANAAENQTGNPTAKNVIVHKSNLQNQCNRYFILQAGPDARALCVVICGGASLIPAILLYMIHT